MNAFKVFKETIKCFKETGDSISFYRLYHKSGGKELEVWVGH